ncbi:hypothetical protein ACP4I1_32410 [Streptomyces sp. WG4]|uniref:hypothetical protein n=1 Tax=Streptomyces sp. WG4 TaxID=3417649 RepID=UPI003CEBA6A4
MASAHDIMQRMKAIQAAREEAIQPLLEVMAERQELQRKLAELDEPYSKAFSQAETGGWTTEELRELGAEEPAKRPKGRPRSRRSGAKKVALTAPPADSSAGSRAASVPTQSGTADNETATAASATS